MGLVKTIITILFLSITVDVIACSCVGSASVEKEIRSSEAVVVGNVISKELIQIKDLELMRLFPNDSLKFDGVLYTTQIARYKFLVETVYKGKFKSDTIEVFTGLGGGDCGNRFIVGSRYILYGAGETYMGQVNNNYDFPKGQDQIWTNSCTRTRQFEQAEIDEIERFRKKRQD
jgi:hypothetical protein